MTVTDVNDNAPVLKLPKECASVTEFHDPGVSIAMIKATDADDNFTPNGRTEMHIVGGNELSKSLLNGPVILTFNSDSVFFYARFRIKSYH